LQTIQQFQESDQKKSVFGMQISAYADSKNEYLVLSSANKDPFKKDIYRSISIGMLLSPHLKKKLQFLKETNFPKQEVGVTCESCSVQDCTQRVAEPWHLQKQARYRKVEQTVEEVMASYE
jgi:hypothetical protein